MATAGFVLFGAIAAMVLWLELRGDNGVLEPGETAFGEVFENGVWALLLAAPPAIAFIGWSTWSAVRQATRRLDTLADGAQSIDAHKLGDRLPTVGVDDEIERLAIALNRLLTRIDHGVAAQRDFAAEVSHELRTPITAIITALEVARMRSRSSDDWQIVADRVLGDARRMSAVVESLLCASRGIDADTAERFSLAEWLQQLVDTHQASGGPAIEFTSELPDCELRGDSRTLSIAVGNVLRNAATHGPRCTIVRIACTEDAEFVRIAIEDDGPGVRAEDQRSIFTAFARGNNAGSSADQPSGWGLGLAISRRIITAHRGRIHVDAEYTLGARFVIELPKAEAKGP
jgi:signal transduction histidine kinase